MKSIFKVLGLTLFLGAFSAQAGILVEPLIGLNFNHKIDDKSGMGAAFGGRLGYQNLGLQLGLDYLNSSTDMNKSYLKSNFKSQDWAAFIGYRFPMFVKVYAGYIFSATGDVKVSGGGTAKFKEGSGTKVGVAFTGLPFVDLNVEYRKGTYDKSSGGDKMDFSATLISLSLPLNL